ncbi:MAG: hypothetical protein JWP63_2601, partial [Candidatus Solibacter sp.]|nr:hypothetical protein [Candidatus Solibacter sp.]
MTRPKAIVDRVYGGLMARLFYATIAPVF